MALNIQIANTAIPYKSYIDITSEQANFVSGSQNIMTTSQQLMERFPGFADSIESAITTFTAVKRHWLFPKWDGTFYSIVCDVSGGFAKLYKFLIGTDTSYTLIFTSTSSSPFDAAISNNTMYFGNGTDMRKYISGTSTTKWGITAPAAAPTIGTTGTGITAYVGWYYRYTYCNSSTGHESSASPLSACTGIVSNKTVSVTVVASSDTQVDQIRVYRTTDGGSTDPNLMQELSNSPFSNAGATLSDTTADTSLGTRLCPGTTSNDPPTASSKLCTFAGRIYTAVNATSYFSALEELPQNGVPEESFPSGLDGNSKSWPQAVNAQAPLPDGVAVFTQGKIWEIQGDRRDNLRYPGLLDLRGAISATAVTSLGGSVAWLDTSSQVWMDDQEIGFDIRSDIKTIDHTQAYLAFYLQGRFHWLCLLDGANGKIYTYDLDSEQWMPPKVLPAAASALSSGQTASGTVSLVCALNKTKIYKLNSASYNDGGTTYTPTGILNLLRVGPPEGKFLNVSLETNAKTATYVGYELDDDPTNTSTTFTDISANVSDPIKRDNGTNLVKKIYRPDSSPRAERASIKFQWANEDANFNCFTVHVNDPQEQPGG